MRGIQAAKRPARTTRAADRVQIPTDVKEAAIPVDGRVVHLTNLNKPFWPGWV